MALPSLGCFAEFKAFAEEELNYVYIEPQYDLNRDEELEAFVTPEYFPMFSFPEEMRGVYITPTMDYAAPDSNGILPDDETIAAQVEKMLDRAESHRLNSVIINTDYKGERLYSADLNQAVKKAAVEYAVEAAKGRGLYVYLNFNINFALSENSDLDLQHRIDLLALRVHTFAAKYPVDGIILDGYYSSKNVGSLNDYMRDGSGIGFDNWLLDNGAYVFSLAADAIRKTNNTIPVGIAINDVWANYTTKQEGSNTAVDFEALTDGYADTVGYIHDGYADFIILRADGSRSSSLLPFNEIVSWWDERAKSADVPMFVNHRNERICTDAAGWGSPDELVKQVIEAGGYGSYGGSAFNSLSALDRNMMSSTTVLIKHFDDRIDLEGLNNELEMTLPTKTTFTTEEPTAIFAGTFDPNFEVYFQGDPIVLNEAGRFYFVKELDVGVNTFTFRSKARTVTYRITRTIKVLRSAEPVGDTMRVEEQSTIALSAIAYKGSVVTAKINGKSVTLKEVESQLDELDPNSNYTKYIGYYTAPQGIRGKDIDLGNVEFYGTYPTKTGNFNESRTGAKIIVNALAEILNDFSGSLLSVNNDNTMTYDYRSTDNIPTPDMSRLPAGTLDYIVKKVTYAGTDYYLTNSGKRVRTDSVTVLANRPLGSNPISITAAGKDGADTFISLKMPSRAPFSISYAGQNFSGGAVSSFDASGIVITFDYITSVSAGNIRFPDSAVFTEGRWSTHEVGEMTKTRLTLQLRQQGIYAGVTAKYDDAGNLVLRFKGYKTSLRGATVVIDPGHGFTGPGKFDPGAVGHIKEQEANLAVSKLLERQLTDEGARVYRLNTESEVFVTDQRASYARRYNPDMFISIHCNAASSGGKGAEVFYFSPFSQPLARSISASLGSYLSTKVHGGGDLNRGAKYNYFFVTQQQEFPSVLVELGFVTNYTEAMALANAEHQRGLSLAVVSGIKTFMSRSNYSSYGDGSAIIEGGASLPPPPDYPETPPVTPEDIQTTVPDEDDYFEDDSGYDSWY